MTYFYFALVAFFSSSLVFAGTIGNVSADAFAYRAYAGAMGGYGSTTWQGLVPSFENQGAALNLSTPIQVEEGGGVWGFFAGYEITPYFALEASYAHYPDARVIFDEFSLFAFENDGQTELNTKTETVSLMAKVMLIVPETFLRIYSGVGIAAIQRTDNMMRDWRVAPTFGAGANYHITPHVMGELSANYTAGYGESELNPAKNYIPFLYAGFFKLAYMI